MSSFEGKAVVVAGGASGIGRATVERFASLGAGVIVGDIQEPQGSADDDVHFQSCDVSDYAQVEALVAGCEEQFGKIDVMVNNAGLELTGAMLTNTSEEFERLCAVNLVGVFNGIKAAAPRLAEHGGGAIVSTASVAGTGGGVIMGPYAATKAGVINLTQTAAIELREMGIRVNCVCPGIIQTPMLDRIKEPFESVAGVVLDELVPLRQGRFGEPEDIARGITYLASDEAEFVSGIALRVDNALSAACF